MSEYGWSRNYCLWEINFSLGIKYIASMIRRNTGENVVEKNLQNLLLTRLAELQG